MKKVQPNFEISSATRLSEIDFWNESYLGRCLKGVEEDNLKVNIFFENKKGLSELYNKVIFESEADYLIFLHDDVFVKDEDFFGKIIDAHNEYDVVGVVGAKDNSPTPPAWHYRSCDLEKEIFLEHSSWVGEIYGTHSFSLEKYGPTPHSAVLIDGCFISVKLSRIKDRKFFLMKDLTFTFMIWIFPKKQLNRVLN